MHLSLIRSSIADQISRVDRDSNTSRHEAPVERMQTEQVELGSSGGMSGDVFAIEEACNTNIENLRISFIGSSEADQIK